MRVGSRGENDHVLARQRGLPPPTTRRSEPLFAESTNTQRADTAHYQHEPRKGTVKVLYDSPDVRLRWPSS